MHIPKLTLVISSSLLLAACGGGDDSSIANDLFPSTSATLNTQNSAAWVNRVFERVSSTPEMGKRLTATTEENDFVGGVSISSHFNIVDYAKQQMERAKNAGSFVTGAVFTEPCETSGTITLTLTDRDNNGEVSIGDTITTTANNCVERGNTMQGQIAVTVFEDEPNFSMTIVYTDSSTTNATGTSFINGDLSLERRLNQFGSAEFISIHSENITFIDSETASTFDQISLTVTTTDTLDSLTMRAENVTNSEAGVTETLRDFSLAYTEDSNTLLSTLDFKGIFSDPEAPGGAFSVETLQLFEGFTNADHPYTGTMKITAVDNSSVTFTVLDVVNVRLAVDENGDGAVDQTTDTTWESIDT